jgi:adenine/guanine phosphoribosyltransferase-like PRPP-binding protein
MPAQSADVASTPGLVALKTRFLVSDACSTPECLSRAALIERTQQPLGRLPDDFRAHVAHCPRCAHLFAAYRSVNRVAALPARFDVPLSGIELPRGDKKDAEPTKILGLIDLETLQLRVCEEPDEWSSGPLHMRVNLVLDPEVDFLSLTLLDVPDEIGSVAVTTPRGLESLVRATDGTYELTRSLDEYRSAPDQESAFLTFLRTGLLKIVFERLAEDPRPDLQGEVLDLLAATGAVERNYDYVLPCGLHSDTHVRVGKLCHSEETLRKVAECFDRLFGDLQFDTIVASGWAMAAIARRLAERRKGPRRTCPHVAMSEGYTTPRLLEDIPRGSKVLILVDVVVTGGLVQRIRSVVRSAGAEVAGAGVVVRSQHHSSYERCLLRPLCQVKMELTAARDCPRCGRLERREFNPFSYTMTARTSAARSPSQFLEYDARAREFWQAVDLAEAYEHHHIERDVHYTAFVDTLKLLQHRETGPRIVESLVDLIMEQGRCPGVILTTSTGRAAILARSLVAALSAGRRSPIPVLTARTRNDHWHLPPKAASALLGKHVLIVDTAVGHGCTLDGLHSIARANGASSTAGAFILSRLSESAEDAFRARLEGGFHRLYHLPIRPVLIRGHQPGLCPVCNRKTAVSTAAKETRLEAIRQLAAWLTRRPVISPRTGEEATRVFQPALFPVEADFLTTCSSKVASGVTLHSLHAGMNNGMAPLALPEAGEHRIPAKNRVAMVEHLPPGVLAWSRGHLDRDLRAILSNADHTALWNASAGVLARERHTEWVEELGGLLERCAALRLGPRPLFWNTLVCHAYLSSHSAPEEAAALRTRLVTLIGVQQSAHAARGLQQMLEAVDLSCERQVGE